MIEIYYYKTNPLNPNSDWGMLVRYGRQDPATFKLSAPIYPTKADLKNGYAKLPIPQSFWKQHGVTSRKHFGKIVEIMNIGANPMAMKYAGDVEGRQMQQWLRDHGVYHTSMSEGDVVVINGKAYLDLGGPIMEMKTR